MCMGPRVVMNKEPTCQSMYVYISLALPFFPPPPPRSAGIAETGSGKTCAFVLPMLEYIRKLPPMTEENQAEGPYSLVMAPTRELAQQIEEETVKFAHYLNYRVTSIVGGQSIEEQAFVIGRGCEIVIATPGRMADVLDRRFIVLSQCNYIVLDEADRMLDMGFEPQVMAVLDAMPSATFKPDEEDAELNENRIYRVTYMFSATMPPGMKRSRQWVWLVVVQSGEGRGKKNLSRTHIQGHSKTELCFISLCCFAAVERLARRYLRQPAVVVIGSAGKAADRIRQDIFMVKDNEKPRKLQEALQNVEVDSTIIFVNTKKSCDYVAKMLDKEGYRSVQLHGGKNQEQRENALSGFRSKRYERVIGIAIAISIVIIFFFLLFECVPESQIRRSCGYQCCRAWY